VYPSEETGCFANLFLSEGKRGPVLYIRAKKRTGKESFTNAIRAGLQKVDKCKGKDQIGLGGVFKVKSGKVKASIMPNFITCDFNDNNTINKWLKFFEMGPNLLMFSCILSNDPSPDARYHLCCEHTHFYSLDKNAHEGGHYHNDATPEKVEYEGYFSVAEELYRVEDAFYNIQGTPMPEL